MSCYSPGADSHVIYDEMVNILKSQRNSESTTVTEINCLMYVVNVVTGDPLWDAVNVIRVLPASVQESGGFLAL